MNAARAMLGLVAVLLAGCLRPAPAPPATLKLAVLLAESNAFPRAAEAASASLASAQLQGADEANIETQVASVSLEVVQLSIECVEPTDACYHAVGRTLAANKLLFAQLSRGPKRRQARVVVTLFDVDARATTRRAEKVFASERAAIAGIADLVGEAMQP